MYPRKTVAWPVNRSKWLNTALNDPNYLGSFLCHLLFMFSLIEGGFCTCHGKLLFEKIG